MGLTEIFLKSFKKLTEMDCSFQYFRVYDEFTDGVTADQQGNLYVTADLPDNGVLFSYLLSFGDNVEILEPANVREQMKEKLISMLQKYET